jgi:microcystin-dependent protein
MSEPFMGQIELFAFAFAPRAWAQCAGQLMSIPQNQALFSLLGTIYGGDGIRTFALPDLRGRVPLHQGVDQQGNTWDIGAQAGEEQHKLVVGEIPLHIHGLQASSNTTTTTNTEVPGGSVNLSVTTGTTSGGAALSVPIYVADSAPTATLDASAISEVGGQPHENRMPTLAMNYCICLVGTYPSPT